MAYAFYVAVKLLAYIAWCWVALRRWQPNSGALKAIGFGLLRLAIGVGFGFIIFFAMSTGPQDLLWRYIVVYAPVRLVEWSIFAWIIGRASPARTALNSLLWCLGGIVVSFAADFASPEGVAGHFCVGRCLC